jgi:hypothetical protein
MDPGGAGGDARRTAVEGRADLQVGLEVLAERLDGTILRAATALPLRTLPPPAVLVPGRCPTFVTATRRRRGEPGDGLVTAGRAD